LRGGMIYTDYTNFVSYCLTTVVDWKR
jgi:hypothetical protein